MNKTDTVRARINPNTKALADKMLESYGLTHSAFINLSYNSLINGGGIPISKNIPNAETIAAIREDVSQTKTYSGEGSFDEMMADILTESD